MASRRGMVIVVVGVLAVLWACNLPQGARVGGTPVAPRQPTAQGAAPAATGVPPAALTMAASTAAAALTQTAESAPPPTPTLTPTVTLTPTLTPTPTPSTPMVSVSVNTNCRTGPGDAYPRVGALLVGETAEVLARDPYGQFWYIPNPHHPGSKCWIWGQYATVTGDTSSLPVFTPPPTPTPAANFAIVGVGKDVCWGTAYYMVQVKNTGGVTWKSYHVKVEDLNNHAAVSHRNTLFPPSHACVMGIFDHQTFPPGQNSFLFPHVALTPGHQVRFTVTLYTGEGQSGHSLTKVAEYTLP